jgi:hypothetical protein
MSLGDIKKYCKQKDIKCTVNDYCFSLIANAFYIYSRKKLSDTLAKLQTQESSGSDQAAEIVSLI